MVEVMAVDRPDVIEAQFLEHRAAGPEIPGEFFGLAGAVVDELRQMAAELLGRFAHRAIGAAGDEAGEIGRERAGRRGDRHFIVVEDDDQARMHRAGIVHRLIGHAGRHGAVADDRDDIVVGSSAKVRGDRHAEAGRDRGRGMGRRRTGRIRSPSAW